mmetsp:Transcript_51739/g.143286  ORF Transcript_51739/g.143286 Transcript_51739/m.143286 type:complete len:158 (+) Transcript_51739:560-1033(+)
MTGPTISQATCSKRSGRRSRRPSRRKKRKRWEQRLERRQAQGGAADSDEDSPDVSDSDDSSDEEQLPEACPECSNKWEDCKSIPVQTQCGHYFCEDCALTNFAKTPKCLSCDAPTNGIFNSCEALEEKVKAKRAMALERKKTKRAASQRLYGHGLEK